MLITCWSCKGSFNGVDLKTGNKKGGGVFQGYVCPACKQFNSTLPKQGQAPTPKEPPKEKQSEPAMIALTTELKEVCMCINELIKVLEK